MQMISYLIADGEEGKNIIISRAIHHDGLHKDRDAENLRRAKFRYQEGGYSNLREVRNYWEFDPAMQLIRTETVPYEFPNE